MEKINHGGQRPKAGCSFGLKLPLPPAWWRFSASTVISVKDLLSWNVIKCSDVESYNDYLIKAVTRENVLTHLDLGLDVKFNLSEHMNLKINKANKLISVIKKNKKPQSFLTHDSTPLLDLPSYSVFSRKFETVITITFVTKGNSKKK